MRWKSVIILSGYCCVSSQTASVDRVDRTSQLVDRPLFAVLRNEGRPPHSLEARKLQILSETRCMKMKTSIT